MGSMKNEKNTDPAIRVVMLPRDTNERGTIFGGVLLSHIDLAGAVEASQHAPKKFVTVAMDKIDFIAPVNVGDVVSFYTHTTQVGRTSIKIHVDVFAARRGPLEKEQKVTEADLVFVAVDEDGVPTPIRD